jgi:hypothetical protein
MYGNQADDWQALSENYRAMLDGELENLAEEIDTLTETAQQVLRAELKRRGLAEPGAKQAAWSGTPAQSRFASRVDPNAQYDGAAEPEASGDGAQEASQDYTWKTPLRDCDSEVEARALSEVLRRAGIDSWVELPGGRGFFLASPRVMVAADQLEQASVVAQQPISQEILDDLSVETPEFETPRCPACHAEDPTLESTEPSNSWLCEECGEKWADPVEEAK